MKGMPVKGPQKAQPEVGFPTGSLVMYDNDGSSILATVLCFKKDRYSVLNERGRELEMPAVRLHKLPSTLPSDTKSVAEKTSYLSNLRTECQKQADNIPLEELWNVVATEEKEWSSTELSELYYSNDTLQSHLSLRLRILQDKIYFKRGKDGFAARPSQTVDELKRAEISRQEREKVRLATLDVFTHRLKDNSFPIPPEANDVIRLLEDMAVGNDLDPSHQKEAKELMEAGLDSLKLKLTGTREQIAYALLEKLGIFHPCTNLSLLRYRPPVEFSEECLSAARAINEDASLIARNIATKTIVPRLDLRHLDSFTIDDASTKDMDDALSLERTATGYRLGVHVSDVASILEPGSVLEREAYLRATSIYLPENNIPMLPHSLSEGKLSLVAGEDRLCLSCIYEITPDLQLVSASISPSIIKVSRRYSYDQVDALLQSDTSEHDAEDIHLLYNLTVNLETARLEAGALKIYKHELVIDVHPDGSFEISEIDEHGPARSLIAETAILANSSLGTYTKRNKLPVVYRTQEAPEKDSSTLPPEGPARDYAIRSHLKKSLAVSEPGLHSSLAVNPYIQATSPIRRYVDLCNQRQILHHLRTGTPFYSKDQIEGLITAVEEPLSRAIAVSRETRRYWLLKYLERRSKQKLENDTPNNIISGVVLRTDLKNPLVELDEIFMTAIVKPSGSVRVGDKIKIRIATVDPRADYLKLEQVR